MDQIGEPRGFQNLDLIAQLIEELRHFQPAAGLEPHRGAAVGFFLDLLVAVEAELGGGGGAGREVPGDGADPRGVMVGGEDPCGVNLEVENRGARPAMGDLEARADFLPRDTTVTCVRHDCQIN